MMNRTEMREEMMAQVNGGREFNIGDHVEVKNTFFGTSGGTITDIRIRGEARVKEYYVKMNHWYDPCNSYWYTEWEIA